MFLKLGIVGRALGLQGSFYVSGRDEAIPLTIKVIKIGRTAESARDAEVISRGIQKGRPFLKCSLASDRTAAESLTGLPIWISADQIKVDETKEFLLKDLEGRSVLDVDGKLMGSVVEVVKMPASINIVVLKPDGSADLDIPMISTYVNMSFDHGGADLHLVVPMSTFDEIWNERTKK